VSSGDGSAGPNDVIGITKFIDRKNRYTRPTHKLLARDAKLNLKKKKEKKREEKNNFIPLMLYK
jgi:hypothetical protein